MDAQDHEHWIENLEGHKVFLRCQTGLLPRRRCKSGVQKEIKCQVLLHSYHHLSSTSSLRPSAHQSLLPTHPLFRSHFNRAAAYFASKSANQLFATVPLPHVEINAKTSGSAMGIFNGYLHLTTKHHWFRSSRSALESFF